MKFFKIHFDFYVYEFINEAWTGSHLQNLTLYLRYNHLISIQQLFGDKKLTIKLLSCHLNEAESVR